MPGPRLRVPYRVAWAAGAAVDTVWARRGREDDPPITRFLAEQLATAHWFDQRRTREALHWAPTVSLDEGFARLAASYAAGGAISSGLISAAATRRGREGAGDAASRGTPPPPRRT